jgi:molecular chaperone GrpE
MIQEEEARREDEPAEAQRHESASGEQPATDSDIAGETPGNAEATDPAAALEAAESEARAQRELALRTAAELENVRRRAQRDVENAHRYGVERFARELLAVKDSMEMGLQAAEEGAGPDAEALLEGFSATLKLLTQCFEKSGIAELNPLGDAFDPELHEAMATQPSAEQAPDSVLMVVQKGYLLHDRLLRPARVIVARAVDE